MNDELVRELKEAGFPKEQNVDYHADAPDFDPTLEELIGACGKDFFQLTKGSACWYAEPDIELQPPNMSQIVQGSTPTEAVARLWLALNPPKA